ncbi:uncharacterized protein Dmoj_GI24252 [Drosophila mojavensis]|uniref:Chitin-binding type-2 domain-containing protein n=1 Tax=Drosophila mojavensis TaxID=7230 RepID=B4K8M7_DROMO|nr:uncharacterized protein Dmoj_GI24252 [Drosophila mojavensis]
MDDDGESVYTVDIVCLLQLPQAHADGKHNHSNVIPDAESSGSERNRRLIPYMAFYLPAPELPINQQYAVKHGSSAGGSQLLAPPPAAPPSRIPVPVAYMPPSHPQQQSHYQSNAADVYHSLAVPHGPHGPHGPLPPVPGKEPPPSPGATFIAYKPLSAAAQKHKTVQHFPPLPQQEQPHHRQQEQQEQQQQQQQQQQQHQYELLPAGPQLQLQFQRQRAKQSKVNLTPFTPHNTLPGHFVPIIYTPLSKSNSNSNSNNNNNNNNNELHNGNTINYNKKQPPTEIVYHKNVHQTQVATDYAGDVPNIAGVVSMPESQSQEEQEQQQQQPAEETRMKQQRQQQQTQQERLHHHHHHQHSSPAPPQFIDYLIDGPRQSLDEEQQQHQQQQQQQQPQQQQHAYILVTTTAPYTDHSLRLPDLPPPTRRPHLYKQQPTLRLQLVTPVHKYQATRRPVYISPPTPSETVKITPKYVYVTSKPPAGAVHSEQPQAPPPIKLKPIHKYAQERPHAPPRPSSALAPNDIDQLPDIRTSSLAEILHKLQASNHLPQTLTPDNIDNSIKTLIRILQNLKRTQTIVTDPPQHHEIKPSSNLDYDYNTDSEEAHQTPAKTAGHVDADLLNLKGPNKHPGPSTGRAGIDYPNYAEIPKTSFECTQQRYKGFFGDPETNCQVWHYCDLNGGKASFLCPNGTIFSQIALTCDWWFNVKCSTTSQLYVLNERLYKYILPFNPKFPEDYNGPIVDKYLAMKFQEMEEKMRLEKQRKANQLAEKPDATGEASTPALPKNHKASPKHGSGINAQVYEQSSERNLLIDDEIDDISERGTFDTYGQAPTTIMAPVPTTTPILQDSQTLGHRPIVVSSTPGPDLSDELDTLPTLASDPELNLESELSVDSPVSSEEVEEKLQNLRDTNSAAGQKQLETTKVSVEKQEVIEIKTDGSTGHLMPIEQARN